MKGNTLVKMVNKVIKHLLGIKNRQIRFERERSRAIEEANKILSAYVTLLAGRTGEVRVSRSEIGRLLGKCNAKVARSGEDYVISIDSEEPLTPAQAMEDAEDAGD